MYLWLFDANGVADFTFATDPEAVDDVAAIFAWLWFNQTNVHRKRETTHTARERAVA